MSPINAPILALLGKLQRLTKSTPKKWKKNPAIKPNENSGQPPICAS